MIKRKTGIGKEFLEEHGVEYADSAERGFEQEDEVSFEMACLCKCYNLLKKLGAKKE